MDDVTTKPVRGRRRPAVEAASPAAIVAATTGKPAAAEPQTAKVQAAKPAADKAARAPVRRAPKAAVTPPQAQMSLPAADRPVPAAIPAPAPTPAVPALVAAAEPRPAAPEPAPVPNLVEAVVEPIAALGVAAPVPEAAAPAELAARIQDTGESLRHAMTESASVATRGLVEINGQMLELMRAQSDAALALWRQSLSAGSMSDAIRLQTSGVRQAYETSAQHWKAIAETASRTAQATMRSMLSTRG